MVQSETVELNKKIPWAILAFETGQFLSKNLRIILIYSVFIFLTLLPEKFDLISFSDIHRTSFWLSIPILVMMSIGSCLISVLFIIWISYRLSEIFPVPFRTIIKNSFDMVIPLTVLSIRGLFLCVFGLFGMILPGIYFYFKYSLASFCLILEGWNNQSSPVERAEQIILRYRYQLFFFVFLVLFEWLGLMLFDVIFSIKKIQIGITFKIILAALQSLISTVYYVYMTISVRYFIRNAYLTTRR